jgi:hypothetical protein
MVIERFSSTKSHGDRGIKNSTITPRSSTASER